MKPISTESVAELLCQLPSEKLAVVYAFVAYLADSERSQNENVGISSFQTMLASESVLPREWDTPEEDAAWAHL